MGAWVPSAHSLLVTKILRSLRAQAVSRQVQPGRKAPTGGWGGGQEMPIPGLGSVLLHP